ncbi:MAG: hypothetical protein D3908_04560 [Candidatus Electrothrix sp. AUS4]|nr:hypothetical protein [Candidatus Electrothrix sp. AUS4]
MPIYEAVLPLSTSKLSITRFPLHCIQAAAYAHIPFPLLCIGRKILWVMKVGREQVPDCRASKKTLALAMILL